MNIQQDVIGMSYDEAANYIEQNGFSVRIVMIDKQPCVVTRDYDITRVNLYMEEGVVTMTTIG